jgi:GNAT superfamily N-acetyltransferase
MLGSRIKMSAQKLQREVLPLEAERKGEREGEGEGKGGNVLVAAWCGEEWVGHAGAVRWEASRDEEGREGKTVVWISQLVVKPGFRRRGLATEVSGLCCGIDGIEWERCHVTN